MVVWGGGEGLANQLNLLSRHTSKAVAHMKTIEVMFEAYAAQLKQLAELKVIHSQYADGHHMICPICQDPLTKVLSPSANPKSLTLEDAPPKALGGTAIAITCKQCNNSYGGRYEKKLVNRMKHAYFQQLPHSVPVPGVIDTPNGELNVKYTRTGVDQAQMELSVRNNNPRRVSTFNSSADRLSRHFTLSVRRHDVGHDQDILASLCKAAYIMIFARMGYVAIMSPALSRLRLQVSNPEQQVFPSAAITSSLQLAHLSPDVYFASSDADFSYIAVRFDLRYESLTKNYCLFVPLISKAVEPYLALGSKEGLNFVMETTSRTDFFNNPAQMDRFARVLN